MRIQSNLLYMDSTVIRAFKTQFVSILDSNVQKIHSGIEKILDKDLES